MTKKILLMIAAVLISFILAFILFYYSVEILSFFFPPIVMIDGEPRPVMPIRNLFFGFVFALIIFIILLSQAYKRIRKL